MKYLNEKEIIKNMFPAELRKSIIYFLIKDEKIVYVGQSTNGIYRIAAHSSDKVFNGYFYKEYPTEKLNDIEAEYIVRFEPYYNNSMPTNNIYKSIAYLKEIYNTDARTLKKFLKNNNIKPYFHGEYYSITEIDNALSQNKEVGA